MDPGSARLVRQSILELRADGRAVIVCTHNLSEAERLADQIAFIRQGRIVASGNAEQLRQTYLGPPMMEVRLAQALNGRVPQLPPGVRLVDCGEYWIRYATEAPRQVNPKVLQALQSQGYQVVTLSEHQRTLEEVYLKVMAEPSQVDVLP